MDNAEEWFKQEDYDFDTAKYMFVGRRYSYTVFMCHLCIEKALKGLYQVRFDETPPKTHNLLSLLLKLDIEPEKTM
jgi:HEPN domain-containing protein